MIPDLCLLDLCLLDRYVLDLFPLDLFPLDLCIFDLFLHHLYVIDLCPSRVMLERILRAKCFKRLFELHNFRSKTPEPHGLDLRQLRFTLLIASPLRGAIFIPSINESIKQSMCSNLIASSSICPDPQIDWSTVDKQLDCSPSILYALYDVVWIVFDVYFSRLQ